MTPPAADDLAADLTAALAAGRVLPLALAPADAAPEDLAAAAADDVPVPAPHQREGYCGDDHWGYWTFGLADYRALAAALPPGALDAARVLDLGGATGRVARHLAREHPGCEAWVADLNADHVAWLRAHAPRVRCFQNTAHPHLPFPDAHFDVVTAYSVFTHVDYAPEALLLELARVTRPGGTLWLTFHSETTWAGHRGTLLETLLREYPGYAADADALAAGRPGLRAPVVSYRKADDPYMCMVFHAADHVRREWARLVGECEVVENAHGCHAVARLTVRRRARAAVA